MIDHFKALKLWAQSLCAIFVGGIGALAQQPFAIVPLIIVMMALGFMGLLTSSSMRHAAHIGWMIGFGYFLITLQWITAPFQVDAATTPHGWRLSLWFFMAGGMALFWGHWRSCAARYPWDPVWALVVTWPLVELVARLRLYWFSVGHAATGFG